MRGEENTVPEHQTLKPFEMRFFLKFVAIDRTGFIIVGTT